MGVIQTSIFAFLLHEQPFERFRFARWQSVVAITLLGICSGLDPNMAGNAPDTPHPVALPLWGRIGIGVVTMWLAFWVIYGFCRWWLKRGGRWDGQGDLFNLIAASWLVVDLLGFLLSGLGVPESLVTLVWFYAIWVGANAMSGAIPKSQSWLRHRRHHPRWRSGHRDDHGPDRWSGDGGAAAGRRRHAGACGRMIHSTSASGVSASWRCHWR